MRFLNIDQLTPEMILHKTIYNHRGDVLIVAGSMLSQNTINSLNKFGISSVWIEDEESELVSAKDTINIETRSAAINQIKTILLETKESGRLIVEPAELYRSVESFANELFDSKDLLYSLSDLKNQDNYTFIHSVNVCILSMMTGITLGYSRHDICTLGVGALLHDLGKVRIPDEILNKPGPLTKDEFFIMKKHTLYGRDLIVDHRNLDELTARIACEHHEAFDGSGYPNGIAGKNIHEFSQIVAISDKFDAITANRVYREAFPHFEAYEMCAAAGDFLSDKNIVNAFMENITPYPPGTLVSLSNGMVGTCIDVKKGYARFPTVLAKNNACSDSASEDNFEINLLENPEISIVKVI
ncbi:MAG: HD-GYP domain-containing protein [Peptococcaceae bacterium]|nr:HD-GYP domain-containing protein [Peptococcaceae bacterium]